MRRWWRKRKGHVVTAVAVVVVAVLAVVAVRSVASPPESDSPVAAPSASPDSAPGQLGAIFLGDSATEDGSAGINGASHSTPWPIRVAVQPDSPWLQVTNMAASGEDVFTQVRRWKTSGADNPYAELVVAMVGTVDAARQVPLAVTRDSVSELIISVREAGDDVVLVSPPPNNSYPERVGAVVDLERSIAREAGVEFIDVFHGLSKPNGHWKRVEWTVDGVAPSEAGQSEIASFVLEAVGAEE